MRMFCERIWLATLKACNCPSFHMFWLFRLIVLVEPSIDGNVVSLHATLFPVVVSMKLKPHGAPAVNKPPNGGSPCPRLSGGAEQAKFVWNVFANPSVKNTTTLITDSPTDGTVASTWLNPIIRPPSENVLPPS